MEETTLQFVAILATVTGLLGWLLRQVIGYFIKSSDEKTRYIEEMVGANQKNTENFVNTINHQRSLDRETQQKTTAALIGLSEEIANSNKMNDRLISVLSESRK
jgi:alcohol dehydrogenase class IV